VEKTVIDRCVHLIYRKYFADPCPENMPILEDLYNALLQQDEKEAHHVATALEIYVKGSLNLFNHRTNVNVNNRIVCYDIKELGKQMLTSGNGTRSFRTRWAVGLICSTAVCRPVVLTAPAHRASTIRFRQKP